jgi:hypothetical protein
MPVFWVLRERVGVRGSKSDNCIILKPPHPVLLPEGEGIALFASIVTFMSLILATQLAPIHKGG